MLPPPSPSILVAAPDSSLPPIVDIDCRDRNPPVARVEERRQTHRNPGPILWFYYWIFELSISMAFAIHRFIPATATPPFVFFSRPSLTLVDLRARVTGISCSVSLFPFYSVPFFFSFLNDTR